MQSLDSPAYLLSTLMCCFPHSDSVSAKTEPLCEFFPRSIWTSSLPHLPSIDPVLKSQFQWNPWNLNSIINIFYYELSLFIEETKLSTTASWFSLPFKRKLFIFSPHISRITTFPNSHQHFQTIILSLLFKKVRCTFIYVPIYHE